MDSSSSSCPFLLSPDLTLGGLWLSWTHLCTLIVSIFPASSVLASTSCMPPFVLQFCQEGFVQPYGSPNTFDWLSPQQEGIILESGEGDSWKSSSSPGPLFSLGPHCMGNFRRHWILLCPLHAMCISVHTLQKGMSCVFSKRGVRDYSNLLFCSHFLVCVDTLEWAPSALYFWLWHLSCSHHPLHFVAPVQCLFISLLLIHPPHHATFPKLQKGEKYFPLSQHSE